MITSELADIDNLLNDFHRELADYQESISFDAESFNRTEERLNLLNHLKAKYGGSIEKVLSYKKEKGRAAWKSWSITRPTGCG
ncbi:MAG: hypothetical protein ACLR6B_08575 [Blautia sp.]